ncbi:MAG: hypothetical protein FWH15_03595 [Betaproteobacteria bacterium]|nr:hypothetical protein [Betaproteobacteria bacterium]
MNLSLLRLGLFLLASFLAGCSLLPADKSEDRERVYPEAARPAIVDRVGHTPAALLSYYHALSFFSASELSREKELLFQSGDAPDTRLRMAMVMGHPLQPNPELRRAAFILADLMQARDSVSYYLRPITQVLAVSYNERLRLEQQIRRQNAQLEKQHMRILEAQRQSRELEEALKGLADIERSLPRARNR